MKIVLASNNAGKVNEFNALFEPLQITILPQSSLGVNDIEETGLTFVENAILKARHAATITGLPSLADDSGLVVPALGGAPGIYSARYAGEKASAKDNIQKLLASLENVSDENREAFFYCALVFMRHASDPTPLICEGKWSGRILPSPKGEQGFGYDPVFYVSSENKTAAELPLAIKNTISHRGLALQTLLKMLSDKL